MRKHKIINLLIFLTSVDYVFLNILPRLSYDTKIIPKKKIDLDLPVKERYKDLLIEYKDKIKAYSLVTSLMPFAFLVSKLGKYFLTTTNQDPEWIEYIEAVSEYCEIPLSSAIMLSVTYDIACTSVVIQDNEGNIFMGRNLDFGTYFVIAHLMIEVEYYKKGNLLYKGMELLGFRGAINAVKPGKFAASLNLRRSHNYKLGNLYRVSEGYPTPNFNLMKVMEKADSFEEALELLSNNKLSAPVFYTVAGLNKNNGAVIARETDSIYRIDRLDVDNGKWFVVICNTDIDKTEPDDNYRRIPTEENIQKIGRENINYENLLNDVMSRYPTNNIITVYSTIQSANGYFNSILWLP